MDVINMVLIFLIGFIGSFLSGMLMILVLLSFSAINAPMPVHSYCLNFFAGRRAKNYAAVSTVSDACAGAGSHQFEAASQCLMLLPSRRSLRAFYP